MRQPAHALATAPRRVPLPLDSGRSEPQAGWHLALGRLRRLFGKRDDAAESAWTGTDWTEREAEHKRPMELIESYSAADLAREAEEEPAEPEPEEPAAPEPEPVGQLAEPEPAEPEEPAQPEPEEPAAAPAEAQATAAELPEPGHVDRAEEPEQALMSMLGDQIDAARQTHYALTLVAVRLVDTPDEAAPEPEELRDRVRAAAHQALVSTEEPELVVDAEDHVVWLVLPGLLPRRALDVVSEARRLLYEDRMSPVAVVVAAYPRDGATAAELVNHCRAELKRAGAHTLPADWRSEISH